VRTTLEMVRCFDAEDGEAEDLAPPFEIEGLQRLAGSTSC